MTWSSDKWLQATLQHNLLAPETTPQTLLNNTVVSTSPLLHPCDMPCRQILSQWTIHKTLLLSLHAGIISETNTFFGMPQNRLETRRSGFYEARPCIAPNEPCWILHCQSLSGGGGVENPIIFGGRHRSNWQQLLRQQSQPREGEACPPCRRDNRGNFRHGGLIRCTNNTK